MHYARMLCVCVAHVVEGFRLRDVVARQAEHVAQARVCAARHIDLSLLLASAAEHGTIAAGGDAINNNNNFFQERLAYWARV